MQTRALELVYAWDLRCEADSSGAAIFQTWYWFLVENTLRDELGDDLMDDYLGNPDRHVPVMIELMDQADSPWFDDVDTPAVESDSAPITATVGAFSVEYASRRSSTFVSDRRFRTS